MSQPLKWEISRSVFISAPKKRTVQPHTTSEFPFPPSVAHVEMRQTYAGVGQGNRCLSLGGQWSWACPFRYLRECCWVRKREKFFAAMCSSKQELHSVSDCVSYKAALQGCVMQSACLWLDQRSLPKFLGNFESLTIFIQLLKEEAWQLTSSRVVLYRQKYILFHIFTSTEIIWQVSKC